ncbi:MAG: hypothetical protein KAI97_02645, partial [Gemmatimonadetes bacterium]|nr:hypothetical protein [Gemmatimonadota bacterium]
DIHDRVNYAVTRSSLKVVGPHAAKELKGERGNGNDSGGENSDSSTTTHDVAQFTASDYDEGETGETKPAITLALTIDTKISPIMEYFEIFLPRMLLSNRAADRLGAVYKLVINGTPLM